MTKAKLKIEFGQPEHGWLPVNLRHGDFELQFEASDVPINPIDRLTSAIREITKGMTTEVWWHLEPDGYYFNFEKQEDEYKLKIFLAKGVTTHEELIYEIHGKYESIVMPFYRSVKSFFTRTIDELHWPKTDEKEIEKLRDIVKGD